MTHPDLEWRERGTQAMNAAGLAVQHVGSFLLTALAGILYVLTTYWLLALRGWLDRGCKFPEWLLPKWPRKVKVDAQD